MFFNPQERAFCVGRFRKHLLFIYFLLSLCVYTYIFVLSRLDIPFCMLFCLFSN